MPAIGNEVGDDAGEQCQAKQDRPAEGTPGRALRRQFLDELSGEAGVVNVRRLLAQTRVQPIFLKLFVHC